MYVTLAFDVSNIISHSEQLVGLRGYYRGHLIRGKKVDRDTGELIFTYISTNKEGRTYPTEVRLM